MSYEHQQPPYQYGSQPGTPYPQMTPPPEGGRQTRRSKRGKVVVLGVVIALVLVASAVAGIRLLGGGGDEGPALVPPPNPEEIAFPDAGALEYEAGPEAMCDVVSEVMVARGYQLLSPSPDGGGINCRFGAPGTTLIEDGAYQLMADVYLVRGDAASGMYERFLEGIADSRESKLDNSDYELGELYEFPVGEEGFITHMGWLSGPRSDATAAFRSGDDTFYVAVWGSVQHPGEDNPEEPLPEEVTLREITDIVKSLSGDESAGEPQIRPASMEEYPGLPELGEPLLPAEGTAEERCAGVTATAGELGMDLVSADATISCNYEYPEDIYDDLGEGTVFRRMQLSAADFSDSENTFATEEQGRDLQRIAEDRIDGDSETTYGPLYELPIGESGFMIYSVSESGDASSGRLQAGYVLEDVYVSIEIGGSSYSYPEGSILGTNIALTEEELVDNLTQVLATMDG